MHIRNPSYSIIIIILLLILFPGVSSADVEGIVPGNIDLYLFKSGTGSDTRGVNDIYVTIGDTISVDVYLRNFKQDPVSGINVFMTVNEKYFDVVSQGRERDGSFIPFIKGVYMSPANGNTLDLVGNYSHKDSTDADDNGISGWQLDYIEQSGPNPTGGERPVSKNRIGVAATFKLIAKAPGDSVTISLDRDQFYGRESRYHKPGENDDFSFVVFKTCYITVSGININPPLTDITMVPCTIDNSLQLDDHIGVSSIPDEDFIWQATGNNRVSVSIDPVTHQVTFTAPADFRGYEDIQFTVGTDEQANFDSDILRVTVGHPPVLNIAALPDTIYIYEDSLQVALYLPDIVTDADNEFQDLIWNLTTGANLTWQTTNIPADTLKIMGVKDFFGVDYINLSVSDDMGFSDTARVPVRVYPVNDPPAFTGLPDVSFERTSPFSLDMSAYAADVDGDQLTLTSEISENIIVSIAGMNVTFSESEGFLGSEVIVFTVTDPTGLSDTESLTATVTPLIDPPVWSKIPKIGFPQNQSFSNMILWDYVDDPDGADTEITFEFSNYNDVDSIYVSPISGRIYLYDSDDSPGWDIITVTAKDIDSHEASTQFLVFIGPADGTPITAAIPDTTIMAGTVLEWIDLDDYYYDADNTDEEMVWTIVHAGGDSLLGVEINAISHTVKLLSANPDSSGTDRLIFTVTDPDDKSASDDCFIKVVGKTKPLLDIPSKIGFVTGNKAIIDLDQYAYDPGFSNSELVWSWSGNNNIEIDYEEDFPSYTNPLYLTSPEGWTGWERVYFSIANPFGDSSIDSTLVFSTPDDGSPLAGGLNQVRIKAGLCDSLNIDLDDFYYDADSLEWSMSWSVSGNDSVTVDIDPTTHEVKFCTHSETFEGQEIITLTVSDGVNTGSMDVMVTVYGAVLRNVFSMMIFRNPIQEDYMDIYLKSERDLLGLPALEVRVEGDTTSVNINALAADSLMYYYGSYLLPYDASLGLQRDAVLIAVGTTNTAKAVQDTLSFTYGRLGPGGGKIALGKVAVYVPEGALVAPQILTLVANPMDAVSSEKIAADEVKFKGNAYTLAPLSLETEIPMDIGFSLCCRPDGAGIYRSGIDGWEFAGGSVSDKTVYAQTLYGGTYRLGYDRTPPKIKLLDSGKGIIAFSATDYGSGIDMNSITVSFENSEVPFSYDYEKSAFIIHLSDIFNETDINLKITVSDKTGNTKVEMIDAKIEHVPGQFVLEQNVPNPFNPSTTITFKQSSNQKVTIEIYDILGRKVRILTSEYYPAGKHSIIWNAADDSGRTVSSGTYLYRVMTDSHAITRKMLFIR